MSIETVNQLNAAFRQFARENRILIRKGLPQNSQPADTRIAYVDYVDMLARNGQISETLASKATYF